jgi:acetylglutamate kinase
VHAPTSPVVIKFGGELLEDAARLRAVVAALGRLRSTLQGPLLVVHGGGKEIDAALKVAGLERRQVDGLRITDEATLGVVVAVLAGAVNTRVVAALQSIGVAAVGLTGADDGCGLSQPAPPHRTVAGDTVDLGRVGIPLPTSSVRLLTALMEARFVPVVASIGVGRDGSLFNVNADTLAGHLAGRLQARRLVIAGTTAGVLDDAGRPVASLDNPAIERLIASRTATAGMIAKLRACEQALAHGVGDVVIVDGTSAAALEASATEAVPARATIITGAGLNTCATGE